MEVFNKFGFIPDLARIYARIREVSSQPVKKSQVKSLFAKIDAYHPLSEEDMITLYFAPEEYREAIFQKAAELNELLYEKKMNFYGVAYVNDFCIETCSYCGDNIYAVRENNRPKQVHHLSGEMLAQDIAALLEKNADIPEICILSGDTPVLTTEKWIEYLEAVFNIYDGKIILNIQPPDINAFRKIRGKFPARRLQFRVFQETYDYQIYAKEHLHYEDVPVKEGALRSVRSKMKILYPPKMNYSHRINSQERAILAGFDEYGLGVLFGLNENEHSGLYEILCMYSHSYYMYNRYGLWPASVSFPRVLPSLGVNYEVPGQIKDDMFVLLISIFRLAIPYTRLIITCRESAEFRRRIRPVINIEDFEARPGPGGNCWNNVLLQMEIADRRPGREIKQEILDSGYKI